MQLLGGEQREALGEVEAHLVAEHRERADAGPVLLLDALVEDAAEEIEIGLHGAKLWPLGVASAIQSEMESEMDVFRTPCRSAIVAKRAMVIATARDAADLLAPLFADAEGEKLAVLHLDAEQRLIAVDEWPGGERHEVGAADARDLRARR